MESKMFLNSKGRYQGGGKRPRLDDYSMSCPMSFLKRGGGGRSDRNEGDDNNDSGDDDDDARCTD